MSKKYIIQQIQTGYYWSSYDSIKKERFNYVKTIEEAAIWTEKDLNDWFGDSSQVDSSVNKLIEVKTPIVVEIYKPSEREIRL